MLKDVVGISLDSASKSLSEIVAARGVTAVAFTFFFTCMMLVTASPSLLPKLVTSLPGKLEGKELLELEVKLKEVGAEPKLKAGTAAELLLLSVVLEVPTLLDADPKPIVVTPAELLLVAPLFPLAVSLWISSS